jgi:hypothetical protein
VAKGVPLITPVEVLSVSPVGSAGDTAHKITPPPLLVGVLEEIATPEV